MYKQTRYIIELGNDQETSCDVYRISSSGNRQISRASTIITAKNWPLENGMTYE